MKELVESLPASIPSFSLVTSTVNLLVWGYTGIDPTLNCSVGPYCLRKSAFTLPVVINCFEDRH